MISIAVGDASEVLIGRGLPDDLLPDRRGRARTAVITQPGPAARIAQVVASRVPAPFLIEVPDRDEAKQLDILGLVYDRLVDENLGRADTVVAVGGGAVTDLGGFVAATWMRGVESVLVPTTLLGAVDAAIGGKTGINRRGKNLVGAFWHPSRVIVDLDVLDALPRSLQVEGAAEIIKAGYLAEPSIVTTYTAHDGRPPLKDVVPAAIRVKASIVSSDFRESGDRALLNLGHTVGHAIEVLAGLPHGHAVAVGMAAEGTISELRYGFKRVQMLSVLTGAGLPVTASGISSQEALDLMARDKKRVVTEIRMPLLRGIGDPVLDTVSTAELELALASIQSL